MAVARQLETFQYYTPIASMHDVLHLVPQGKARGKMEELAGTFVGIFEGQQTSLFQPGKDHAVVARDRKEHDALRKELARVAFLHTHDLFSPEGALLDNPTWSNVREIAPTLAGFFLDREDHHIKAVSRQQAANVVALAIDIARNPHLLGTTVLLTAFGGSPDDQTPARLPAYLMPGLEMIRSLQQFYGERGQRVLQTARWEKEHEARAQQLMTRLGAEKLERGQRQEIDVEIQRELDAGTLELPQLLGDEQAQVLQTKGVATRMPTFQIVYGHNAAVAVNAHDGAIGERIRRRTGENMRILKDELTTYHGDVMQHVQFVEDIPWHEQSLEARAEHEYLTSLLQEVEEGRAGDDVVRAALTRLKAAGQTHGGAEGYLRYAAIHPRLFHDSLPFPSVAMLRAFPGEQVQNVTDGQAVITIGGEPEEDFHAVRAYLSTASNVADLVTFIDQQPYANQLLSYKQTFLAWEREMHDQKHYRIHLTTTIGRNAVYYYQTDVDEPYGVSLTQHQTHLLEHHADSVVSSRRSAAYADVEALKTTRARRRPDLIS